MIYDVKSTYFRRFLANGYTKHSSEREKFMEALKNASLNIVPTFAPPPTSA